MDPITILLGAEGCAEAEGADWLRDPTVEELDRFEEENPNLSGIDGTGRPYWPKTLTERAPIEVRAIAERHVRMVRL